jgi:hypothetical protein
MKRIATTSWVLACAFLVAASAQTPQPPTGQQPPQAKGADERTVTLTGCLAAGDQPTMFRLTHIRSTEKTSAQRGEMIGVSGLKTGDAVQLIGTDAAKLKDHVGHTITVTGMIVPRKEGQAAQAKPGTPEGKAEDDMRLNVKSFKHVDTTCAAIGK